MAKNREHEIFEELFKLTLRTKKPSPSTPAAAAKIPQSASKPQEPQPTSSFESESDSESDPDGPSPTIRSTPTQKSTNGARKSKSKSSAPDPVTPSKSVALKRRADDKETDAKDAKKSKKKAEPEISDKKPTDDPKKTLNLNLNHRVWCEEDEIAILKGLIDYSIVKKADPFTDLNDFYNFIKKDLDFSLSQVQEKVRSLRTEYEHNVINENSCKEMTFTEPHEQKVYELSKCACENKNVKAYGIVKVFGSSKLNDISLRKAAAVTKMTLLADKKESKGVAAVDAETESVLPAKRVKSIGLTVEERILKIGTEMFENGKGEAGENEWNDLRIEEMQVYLRHLEVKSAQARLVIERLKSRENEAADEDWLFLVNCLGKEIKTEDCEVRKAAATKTTLLVDKKETKGVAAVDAETESVLPAKRVKSIGLTVEERILTIGTEMFENGKGKLGKRNGII